MFTTVFAVACAFAFCEFATTGTPRGFAVKRRLLTVTILGALVALALVVMAPVALAGDVTRIIYAQNQNDFNYYKVGATAGTFNVSLSWTKADGTGAPTFPVAEVDGMVYGPGPDQLMYEDITPTSLYEGDNPETATVAAQANAEYWFGVAPYVGDVPYHLVVTFTPSGGSTTVIINVNKTAYASDGSVVLPAAGDIYGVFQTYAGTLDRRSGSFASNVLASWNMDMRGFADPYEFFDDFTVNYAPGQPYAGPSATRSAVDALQIAIPDDDVGQQVVVIPQKWGTAAQPNVWNNSFTDVYPKPGVAQTFIQCPAWFTYSFPDGNASPTTSKISYVWPMWTLSSASNASKHNYSFLSSTTAQLTYTFYGTSLTWVYTKLPTCGIASISIDGTPYLVDQYSTTTLYKQTQTWTGLSDGPHTVILKYSGRDPGAPTTSTFITHDAFIAGQVTDSDPYTSAENNYDGMTVYAWPKLTIKGTPMSFISSTTAAAALTFDGNQITLNYVGMPTCGIANVWVDGVAQTPVDEYASVSTTGLSQTWTDLGPGTHTFFMMFSAVHSGAPSTSTFVDIASLKDAAGDTFGP